MMWWCGTGQPGTVGFGWMAVNMIAAAVFSLILLAFGIVILQRFMRLRSAPEKTSTAVDILEQRYARGEIGREEYLQKKNDLLMASPL